MSRNGSIPAEIEGAVARMLNARVSSAADARERELERLAILKELTTVALPAAIQEAVNDSRRIGIKWHEIAEQLDTTEQNAWRKYAVTAGSSPEERRASSSREEREGVNLAEAARLAGLSPATVRNRIKANPNATWWKSVPTRSGSKSMPRVLDVAGLAEASSAGMWAKAGRSGDAGE